MKVYFVRHAPTQCNLTGTMVAGYDNVNIINIKPSDWDEKVGIYIPKEAHKCIISSPARRCVQTSDLLFKRIPDTIYKSLEEYDCKALGDKKFWEIDQEEFDRLVKITPAMMGDKVKKMFESFKITRDEYKVDSCIAVTHGMVIRYLWSYLNGQADTPAYDIINSRNFKFSNLDLMIVDTIKMTTEVHHYKDPIVHNT